MRLWNEDPSPEALLGQSVALSGDTVFVGAPRQRINNFPHGKGYVFRLPLGERSCDGVTNSTGAAASLVMKGDRRVEFGLLEARVENVPSGAFTFLLASRTGANVPGVGGSDGTLCLGGPVSRISALSAGADGVARHILDPLAIPTPAQGTVSIQPGETWHFQVWYRDANPAPTSNFSEAREVTFR